MGYSGVYICKSLRLGKILCKCWRDGILLVMPRVFLSYARTDGELRATEIRERLARHGGDIAIQQYRLFLEGGFGWWKQITEAIDSVEFVVLVVTPAAMASGNVQKE